MWGRMGGYAFKGSDSSCPGGGWGVEEGGKGGGSVLETGVEQHSFISYFPLFTSPTFSFRQRRESIAALLVP